MENSQPKEISKISKFYLKFLIPAVRNVLATIMVWQITLFVLQAYNLLYLSIFGLLLPLIIAAVGGIIFMVLSFVLAYYDIQQVKKNQVQKTE